MPQFRCFTLILSIFSVLNPSAWSGVANPHALWPKKALTVCWSSSLELLEKTPVFLKVFSDGKSEKITDLKILHLPGDLKELIEKSVSDSFSGKLTGIEFTGWKDCAVTPAHDVVLFYARELKPGSAEGSRYLAAADIGYLAGTPGYDGVKTTSIRINENYIRGYQGENFSDRFKNLIRWRYGIEQASNEVWVNYLQYLFAADMVHEFAHVAGLMHEAQVATTAELKTYDISFHQGLTQNNALAAPLARKFGKFNPFSTMSSLFPSYENAAEKTRLICELLKAEKKETKTESYFLDLWKTLSKSAYSPKELQKQFCSDETYLQFHPQKLAEAHRLLNDEDQQLLKQLYSNIAPEKIRIKRSQLFSQKTKYLEKTWKRLTETTW